MASRRMAMLSASRARIGSALISKMGIQEPARRQSNSENRVDARTRCLILCYAGSVLLRLSRGNMTMGKFRFGAALAAILMLVTGLAPASAQTIKVGSKNFTEQYILAEIYAAALENAGFKVERKINLGGTLIAHAAITSGEIDLYPEYTGTALISVVKTAISSDPQKVYDEVKGFYEKEFKITWLKPTGINNGYVLIVRPETAEK